MTIISLLFQNYGTPEGESGTVQEPLGLSRSRFEGRGCTRNPSLTLCSVYDNRPREKRHRETGEVSRPVLAKTTPSRCQE